MNEALHANHQVGRTEGGKLAHAVGEWLGGEKWDAWCTLTFRAGNYSSDAATRAFANLRDWLISQGAPHLSYFVGHEVGGAGGRLHLHGLLGGLPPVDSRRGVWKWWHKRYGRAQVLPYDPEKGAAYYVSKYVSKGLAEWDFDLTGFRRGPVPQLDFLRTSCGDTPRPTRPRCRSGGPATRTASRQD